MDAPTVRLGDPFADAQAEPCPFDWAMGVGVDPVVLVKDVRDGFSRDTDA